MNSRLKLLFLSKVLGISAVVSAWLPAPAAFASDTALLVISSGFNSCRSGGPEKMSMMPYFHQVVQQLQAAGKDVHYLMACHSKGEAVYMQSAGDKKVYDGNHHDYTRFVLKEFAKLPQDTSIHFIGHSWGAWLNMQVVLALPHWTRVGGFVTIDAISKVNCTISEFLDAYLGVSPGYGCKAAPNDISYDRYEFIRGRISWWRNYFQEASELLRSSFIFHADENQRVEFDVPWIDFAQAHRQIDSDVRVWNDFAQHFVMTVTSF